MKAKTYLMIVFFLAVAFSLVLPMVSAEVNELAPVKQNDCVTIKQVCASCSYVNLSISYPNSTLVITNDGMTSVGSGVWTYSFCNTTELGRYDVNGEGDIEGTPTGFGVLWFEVTPSGQSGTSNLIFIIFIIVAIYAINLFGFFGKNEIMTLLGGMFLMFLGVYLINNGIIIYRDNLTNYFSYITIAWGFISSFLAAYSLYQDM